MHWTLTKKDTDDTLILHPQFDWVDEFDWQALVVSEPIYTITGAMIIETGIKQAGRPVTLNGNNAHITRADLKKIMTWASTPSLFTLSCPDGRVFDVIFAKNVLSSVKDRIGFQLADKSDSDSYHATLHFITI